MANQLNLRETYLREQLPILLIHLILKEKV